jgi:hypothetical protein
MDESKFRSLAKWQISVPRYSADTIQYLLKGEEQILQSISTRAPISKILDDICAALDCQIGNTVDDYGKENMQTKERSTTVWVAVLTVAGEQQDFLTPGVQQIQTRSIVQGDMVMAKVRNVGAIRSQ